MQYILLSIFFHFHYDVSTVAVVYVLRDFVAILKEIRKTDRERLQSFGVVLLGLILCSFSEVITTIF